MCLGFRSLAIFSTLVAHSMKLTEKNASTVCARRECLLSRMNVNKSIKCCNKRLMHTLQFSCILRDNKLYYTSKTLL